MSLPNVTDLRRRGSRGGIISAHRSMVGLQVRRRRVLSAVLLALIGSAGAVVALQPIGRLWQAIYTIALPRLGLDPTIATRMLRFPGLSFGIDIPFPTLTAHWPTNTEMIVVSLVSIVLVGLTLVLPSRVLPLAYFVRALVVIQVAALGYFTFATPPFPYELPRYAAGFLSAGAIFLTSVPTVLGLTYYLVDVSLWRKVFLTVLLFGHLIVLFPLQTLVHVWTIHSASLLLQPVLFLVFGLLVDVLVLVAFYGWGMSWPAARPRERRP